VRAKSGEGAKVGTLDFQLNRGDPKIPGMVRRREGGLYGSFLGEQDWAEDENYTDRDEPQTSTSKQYNMPHGKVRSKLR
jgi:hypothetical protein